MENEMQDGSETTLEQMLGRFTAAIERLEAKLESALSRVSVAAGEAVGPIVAMVENSREAELVQKLAEAEQTIAVLRASAAAHLPGDGGRKTLPVSLLAKQESGSADPNALDVVLGSLSGSLSMEQRIAVKSQLLRAGLV